VQQHPYGFADTRFDEVDVVEAVLGSQGSCMTFPDERGRAPTLRPLEAVSLHLVADSGKFSADRVQESKGQVAITQVGVVLRPVEVVWSDEIGCHDRATDQARDGRVEARVRH
jgi:hypothetical protein